MADDYGSPAPGNGALTCGRQPLVEAITKFLAHGHAPGMPEIRAALKRAIDEAGPAAIDGLARRLAAAGSDWSYYPSDPLARRIHHVLARQVLQHEPVVIGAEHLDELSDRPVAIYANHLSYSDANAVEVLLQRAGQERIADRLTVIAGPKVYSNVRRRFLEPLLRHDQDAPEQRPLVRGGGDDVARRGAGGATDDSHRAGTASAWRGAAGSSPKARVAGPAACSSCSRAPPGISESQDAWVVPMGITGTERLFPISEDGLNPVADHPSHRPRHPGCATSSSAPAGTAA